MKIKPIKLFGVMATVTVILSLLATGGLVYADSHADAHATAGSKGGVTDVDVCHDAYAEATANVNGSIMTNIDKSSPTAAEATTAVYAEATSSGDSWADAYVYAYLGDTPYVGTITASSFANATGTDSYADSNIDLHYLIPAGVYYDVAADGNAFAFGILYSDGSDVWAFAYSDARNGGGASVDIWAGEGIGVDAEVGVRPEI